MGIHTLLAPSLYQRKIVTDYQLIFLTDLSSYRAVQIPSNWSDSALGHLARVGRVMHQRFEASGRAPNRHIS